MSMRMSNAHVSRTGCRRKMKALNAAQLAEAIGAEAISKAVIDGTVKTATMPITPSPPAEFSAGQDHLPKHSSAQESS